MYQPRPNSELRTGRSNPPRGSAFSLIELILVMTIISILAAIAVPRYGEALARYRVDAAARRVVADLDYARQLARSSSNSVTVHVLSDTDTVKIIGEPDMNDPSAEYNTRISDRPYHADIVTSDFNGDYIVIYDGYGYPDSDGSVVLSVGINTRTVALDMLTGEAGVQ